MSDVPPSAASLNAKVGHAPPPIRHERAKSESELQYEEARIIFNKTVGGHYRHGKTGYKQVGVLFLTWKDDDMQCKDTEVDKLRDLFATQFHFKTDYYEIPSERWETGLHKRLADFCYEYDSPDKLAIIYYGGHGYPGEETGEFKFSAKFKNDGHGDPRVFFNDIRTCLRLPACDQLMIIDCCYAARAFSRDRIGKKKFELLTSAAHDRQCPAPSLPHSFTKTLTQLLEELLQKNPTGFCTSHLYRELYHKVPDTKPLLFDQAHHNYGKIWLRPQTEEASEPRTKGSTFLKLTLRLNDEPGAAIMNELALHLQFLPHIDEVRFDDLYAPRDQIENFMLYVLRSQRLKPLMRRLHARRQVAKLMNLKRQQGEPMAKHPQSLLKMHLEQSQHSIYDWSSATRSENMQDGSERSRVRRKKSETWPPTQNDEKANPMSSSPSPSVSAESHFYHFSNQDLSPSFLARRVQTFSATAKAQALDDDSLPGVEYRKSNEVTKIKEHLPLPRSPSLPPTQFVLTTERLRPYNCYIDPELTKSEAHSMLAVAALGVFWDSIHRHRTLHVVAGSIILSLLISFYYRPQQTFATAFAWDRPMAWNN